MGWTVVDVCQEVLRQPYWVFAVFDEESRASGQRLGVLRLIILEFSIRLSQSRVLAVRFSALGVFTMVAVLWSYGVGGQMSETQEVEASPEATVAEQKFNATAVLSVTATSEKVARNAAERYFRETHGTRPSNVVVEEDDISTLFASGGSQEFTVMVSDQSSGSLCASETYGWDDE